MRELVKRSLPLDGGALLCVLGREYVLKLLFLCISSSDLGIQEYSSPDTLLSVLLSQAFQMNRSACLFLPPLHFCTEE